VRREDIYRILPRLYELGILEKVIGSPTRVKALPVERAIRVLVRNRQEALSRESAELAYQVEDFLEYFNPGQAAPAEGGDGEQFSIVEGRPAIEGKISCMLEKTRHEVLAAVTGPHALPLLAELPKILETGPDSGRKIRVITGQSEVLTLSVILKGKKSGDLDFRLTNLDGSSGNYLVSDGREAILLTSDEQATRISSLWTNNSIISLLLGNFEQRWSRAQKTREPSQPGKEGPGVRAASPFYPV